jgi:hypothetical protein
MTIQLVDEISEDWLNEVLPHEISHLYFYQVTRASDAWPPLWLDEGLAVYNEFGDHEYEDEIVRTAVLQDRLTPLLWLREDFVGEDHEVDLAYAESYYVALYILDVYGEGSLSQLLSAYNRDKDHDEAFMIAFNQSLSQFEQDWETWIKTKFMAEVPATLTAVPQEQNPTSFPARNVFALLILLCCFSLAGVTGLGFLAWLLWAANKRTGP